MKSGAGLGVGVAQERRAEAETARMEAAIERAEDRREDAAARAAEFDELTRGSSSRGMSDGLFFHLEAEAEAPLARPGRARGRRAVGDAA